MDRGRCPAAILGAALIVGGLGARAASASEIALANPTLLTGSALEVSVPGASSTAPFPVNYAADGRNISPPLTWSAGPASTRSYVVVMQDTDSAGPQAAVHWLVYDIAPNVTALPRGMKNVASPSKPLGAAQGANDHGSFGYSGPRVAAGDPAHHYHLQVFALDRPTRVRPGASLAAVLRAMAGHVVARGEFATTYAPPEPKTHRAPDGAPAPTSAPPG